MIGSLGDIPFVASYEQVRNFGVLERTGGARWAEHMIAGRKPTLEFEGPGLEEVSLAIRLAYTEGLNPREELLRIYDLKTRGEVLALVIGGEMLGMFVILEATESRRIHGSQGELITADVALKLKEYIDDF